MRCEEVAQELSAPTGRLDPDALAGHLAACPRCADWSEQVAKLDRLWDATRPAEPPAYVFDRIWSGVARELESGEEPDVAPSPAPAVLPFRPAAARVGRWPVVVALLGTAAAAALLVAGRFGGPGGPDGPVVAHGGAGAAEAVPAGPEVALVEFDFDQGETPIIHIGASGPPRVEAQPPTPVSGTDTIAASFDVLNYVETLDEYSRGLLQ